MSLTWEWPSVEEPDERGCPYCEARDGEAHQVWCALYAPEVGVSAREVAEAMTFIAAERALEEFAL